MEDGGCAAHGPFGTQLFLQILVVLGSALSFVSFLPWEQVKKIVSQLNSPQIIQFHCIIFFLFET